MSVAPTRRINRGRGHSYLLDGDRADGTTWVTGQGIPKPQFIKTAAETTANCAVDRWDELAELKPSERLKILLAARFEKLRSAGARGTDVHKLAQRHLAGEEIEVPEALEGFVDAYELFVTEWGVEEILVEAVVANRKHRYMGTLDLLARLADRKTWLIDWKTTQSGIWPESALQLAAYRYAEFYLGADSEEIPLPEVEETGCVWLREDGSYDLVPVDTSPETFRTFLYAQQIARFATEDREVYVFEALRPPLKEAV